ncbi:MAG: TIGR02757 family protein [Planctomycetes bacterium]|nr:TIGR02757 family protein [Planctomycetota bacterium]
MGRALDAVRARRDPAADRARDPVRFCHRARDPGDVEVVGLLAALLAHGRVSAIGAALEDLLGRMGPRPARFVDEFEPGDACRLAGFAYRFNGASDLGRLMAAAGRLRRRHGSLGAAFAEGLSPGDQDVGGALARFALALRDDGGPAGRGWDWLVSDPRRGGASKRLNLYLRWMVRPADGVDLGIWRLPPALLVIPLDTHVARISRYVGLTSRRTADWAMALEVTRTLRLLDPADPVKYDFALSHLGISGDCPARRVDAICRGCPLNPVCRLR